MKERGFGRMGLGLVLLLIVGGSFDQTPLNWTLLPMLGVSLLLGAWGVSRAKYGPTLPRLAGLLARMPKFSFRPFAVRRHALIVVRARR